MDDIKKERVYTVSMKRRGCVRVLKRALQDAQRETGDRITGFFGLLITEQGQADLVSAISADELGVVMQALPEALHRVASQMGRDPDEVGH